MPNQPSQVVRDLNLNSGDAVELHIAADILRMAEGVSVSPGLSLEVNRADTGRDSLDRNDAGLDTVDRRSNRDDKRTRDRLGPLNAKSEGREPTEELRLREEALAKNRKNRENTKARKKS